MNYLLLILAWAIYFTIHSVLASNAVKNFVRRNLPLLSKAYRFLYSMISAAGLLAIFFLVAIMESDYFFKSTKIFQYAGMVLAIYGIIVIVAAFRVLSGLSFLGLRKAESKGLVKEGIHSKIRHPIYSGTILIFLGMFLYVPSDVVLISVVCIFAYLPIGIYLEEKRLIAEFGDEYREYKKEVPALVPGLF